MDYEEIDPNKFAVGANNTDWAVLIAIVPVSS
jgi:hypothetical protein